MSRIHKAVEFLVQGESPSDFTPELVYRPTPESVWPADVLLVDYELTRLRKLASHNFECKELADVTGNYQRVLAYVTQFDSFPQVQRDMHAAAKLLSCSGQLRVVVLPGGRPKKVGLAIAELFGEVRVATRTGTSLLVCGKPTPKHFSEEGCELQYTDAPTGRVLRFLTRPGMFSCNRIDAGTGYLLTFLPDLEGCKFLDVGCGYGVVGLVAAARGASVTMIDADARAVKLSSGNAELNRLSCETVLDDQLRQDSESYDFVFTNPPTHAGSVMLQSLFHNMVRVCRRKGQVVMVLREQLNYEKWLRDLGAVERLGTSAGYKVLSVRRGGPTGPSAGVVHHPAGVSSPDP